MTSGITFNDHLLTRLEYRRDWSHSPVFPRGPATRAEAVLLNYNFKHGVSSAGRAEYISGTGNATNGAVNLLYGPGSGAWSITVIPTFQDHGFFVRGDFSFVQVTHYTPGDGFGPNGMNRNQPRGMIETGFMF
jgi:hypothetical protein